MSFSRCFCCLAGKGWDPALVIPLGPKPDGVLTVDCSLLFCSPGVVAAVVSTGAVLRGKVVVVSAIVATAAGTVESTDGIAAVCGIVTEVAPSAGSPRRNRNCAAM